jgi:hypothetical protein
MLRELEVWEMEEVVGGCPEWLQRYRVACVMWELADYVAKAEFVRGLFDPPQTGDGHNHGAPWTMYGGHNHYHVNSHQGGGGGGGSQLTPW